jgi:hypothetical protein
MSQREPGSYSSGSTEEAFQIIKYSIALLHKDAIVRLVVEAFLDGDTMYNPAMGRMF